MLPILDFVPDMLKQQLSEEIIDYLSKQAEKLVGNEFASKIRKFSSQGRLDNDVQQAIVRGC